MNDKILIIGYGPVGAATVAQLRARGQQTMRVAQRKRPAGLAARRRLRQLAT